MVGLIRDSAGALVDMTDPCDTQDISYYIYKVQAVHTSQHIAHRQQSQITHAYLFTCTCVIFYMHTTYTIYMNTFICPCPTHTICKSHKTWEHLKIALTHSTNKPHRIWHTYHSLTNMLVCHSTHHNIDHTQILPFYHIHTLTFM